MGGNFYFLHATSSFPARQQENEWKSTARKSIPKVFCVSSQPFRNRQSFENQQELLNADDSDQRQHASDLYSVRVGISVVQFSVHPIHQLMAAASPHNPSCFRATFLPLAPCPGRSWSNPGCLFFVPLLTQLKQASPIPSPVLPSRMRFAHWTGRFVSSLPPFWLLPRRNFMVCALGFDNDV